MTEPERDSPGRVPADNTQVNRRQQFHRDVREKNGHRVVTVFSVCRINAKYNGHRFLTVFSHKYAKVMRRIPGKFSFFCSLVFLLFLGIFMSDQC